MSISHDAAGNKHFSTSEVSVAIGKDFSFIGRLSLDFAQTGDMGFGSRFERFTSPAEFKRWLSLSPLQLSRLGATKADLRRARTLRKAIWRTAEAILAKTKPAQTDIRTINRVASQKNLVKELDRDGKSMRWRKPSASAALATIAQDAVELFGDELQRARLRRCENSGCIAIFYDDSRPGLRRWCKSNRCGDRVRARLYRRRLRS